MASLRSLISFVALAFVLLFCVCEAKDILVGGSENAWRIPNNASDSLNQWAKDRRFKVGDFLIFKYDGKADSVLEVTKENYDSCSTSKPIKEYKDGNNTKVELDNPGPLYFISGADGHCQKGQKLEITVMSQKHRSPSADAPAPGPAKTSANHAHANKGRSFFGLVPLLGFVFAFTFACV